MSEHLRSNRGRDSRAWNIAGIVIIIVMLAIVFWNGVMK